MNRNDVGLILLFIGCAFVLALLFWNKNTGNEVVIILDGEEYGRYSLYENRQIEIRQENGYNLVVIQNGKASIQEADCKDQYCVKQGETNRQSKSLVCLPHKLVVEVLGDDTEDLDGITQ